MREWRRGSAPITARHAVEAARAYVAQDGSLRIDNATRGDEGNYSCHVRNSEGADRIHYKVSVQGEHLRRSGHLEFYHLRYPTIWIPEI